MRRVALLLVALCACRGAPPLPAPPPQAAGGVRYEILKQRDPASGTLVREWSVKVEPGAKAVLHGRERTWTSGGAPEWEREWKDGAPSGTWTRRWPNGNLRSRVEHRGKETETTMTFWHENGVKALEGPARDGERCGEWCAWRADGTLLERGTYRDSFKEGEWTSYAADGATPDRTVVYERSVRVRTLPAAAPRR